MKKSASFLLLTAVIFVSALAGRAQTADVALRLDEKFFDALLEALFRDVNPPEFPLAKNIPEAQAPTAGIGGFLFNAVAGKNPACNESIKLQRQVDGIATSVRFREGRILAPIAFTGSYNPPLIGCFDFSGVADTTIELVFDPEKKALVGRAQVLDVRLSGTGGIGSALLARMVQSSIDKRINPIRIIDAERVSFVVPIQNSGNLRMRATGIRHEITPGALEVVVTYSFSGS